MLGVGAAAAGKPFRDVFTVPGTNSQSAIDVLAQRFPAQQQPQATVVIAAPEGETLTAPAVEAAVGSMLATIGKQPGVATVTNPFTPPERISKNGRIAIATVSYAGTYSDLSLDAFEGSDRGGEAGRVRPGSRSSSAGRSSTSSSDRDATNYADEIGVARRPHHPASSSSAPCSPRSCRSGVALFGVAIAGSMLMLIATQVTVGTVAPILGSMIGLGVGIDYSLLVVSRYLQDRDEGMEHERRSAHAIGTAGAASLFAGMCVAIALCGLAIAGIPYVATLGFSAGAVRRGHGARRAHAPARGARHRSGRASPRKHKNVEAAEEVGGMWYRWRHVVSRHAGVRAWSASLDPAAVLAAPVLELRLGFTDDGDAPRSADPAQGVRPRDRGLRRGCERSAARRHLACPNGDRAPRPPTVVGDVEKLAGALGKATRASRR